MNVSTFEKSLAQPEPPTGLTPLLDALWYDRRDDWNRAHDITQERAGADAAWVHAYLHRREGDLSNAAYWYRHAGRPVCHASLDEEWRLIVEALLERAG